MWRRISTNRCANIRSFARSVLNYDHHNVCTSVVECRGFSSGNNNDNIRERLRKRNEKYWRTRNSNTGWYIMTSVALMLALTYGSVPLYKIFCQATGYGGTVNTNSSLSKLVNYDDDDDDEEENSVKRKGSKRRVRITFESNVDRQLPWSFKPCQNTMDVRVGESALAFYTAQNHSDKPMIGVATYNVTPMKCGLYFNKIQCFCFDEQRLQANEEIDMPVFFFLDPAFLEDHRMDDVTDIVLSYTFYPSELSSE